MSILFSGSQTTSQIRPVLSGETSGPLSVTSSTLQGSVLGPLLFLLYVNDVNDVSLSGGSKLILYADDFIVQKDLY